MKLFVDMDGTLAEWRTGIREEELYEKGYFLNLKPYKTCLETIKKCKKKGYEIFILTAYLTPHAKAEKQRWLDTYLPFVPAKNRLFVPYGQNKARYVEAVLGRAIRQDDVLLDDHSPNLIHWVNAGGFGVKALNGINGTGGKWQGSRIFIGEQKGVLYETGNAFKEADEQKETAQLLRSAAEQR